MENQFNLWIILHGVIILIIGLIGGFPYAEAIQKQPEKVESWRLFHSGSLMGGILLMVVGAIAPTLAFTHLSWKVVFNGLVISSYSFIAGKMLAALSGKRGLSWKVKGTGRVISILYALGTVISILGTLVLLLVIIKTLYNA